MPTVLPPEANTHHKTPTGKPHRTTLALLVAAVLGLHLGLLSSWSPQAEPPPTGQPASPDAPPTHPTATADSPQRLEATEPPSAAPNPFRPITQVRWIVAATAYDPRPAEKPSPATKPPPPATPTLAQRQTNPAPPSEPTEAAAPAMAPTQEPAARTAAQPDSEQAAAALGVVAPAPVAVPTTPLNATPNASTPPALSDHQPLPPASPPASAQLAYEVSGKASGLNYSARATLNWQLAGEQYSARMELRVPLLGSRVQTSVGRVEPSGLLPERFADKSRSERAAHFDHARQTIRFSNNQPDATLQPGAQDRLSLFMQLAGLLRAQPAAYPAGRLVSLPVAGTSDAEIWRFRVGEEEALTLPAGPLQARHLVREPREPRESRVDIWLAPALAYLPVRIRITQDNGDRVDQQLSQMP